MFIKGEFQVISYEEVDKTRCGIVEITTKRPDRFLRCVFEKKPDGTVEVPQGFDKFIPLLVALDDFGAGATEEAKKFVRTQVSDVIIDSYRVKTDDGNDQLRADLKDMLKDSLGN